MIKDTWGDNFPRVGMFDILNLQWSQTDDPLPDVVDVLLDDGAPHQNVVEQEEMSPLTSLFISLDKEPLSEEQPGSVVQWGPRRPKAVLNHLNSVSGI